MNAADWLLLSLLLNVAAFIYLWVARMARNEIRRDLIEANRKADGLYQHALELEDKVKALEGCLRKVAPADGELWITRILRPKVSLNDQIVKLIREVGGC